MQLSFVTTVENLSDEATTLDLAERIPVAQNPEIRVSQVRVTPARPADSTGIVRWTLSLAPHQRQALRVSYRVDYPATLALEPRSRAADPSAPAPARKRSLDESLADFESQL
jgi:hypothetical protein